MVGSSPSIQTRTAPGRSREASLREALATLRQVVGEYASVAFACSFGLEDVALLHVVAVHALPVRVFTLDTGRLPNETLEVWQRLEARYGLTIERFAPDPARLAASRIAGAPDLIYADRDARLECCHVRKVEPLARALAGAGAWITGQRRAQSVTRSDLALVEWDAANGLRKANPLANWTTAEVSAFVRDHDIPYNRLFDRGYASIGCAPCTRAIEPGEDIRAGRWWWEDPNHKECGLHRRNRA